MSKEEPHIQKFMTTQPFAIEGEESVAKAKAMMSDSKIRHLPVLSEGKVVGILSDRDIKTVCALKGVDVVKTLARDICHEHPYVVGPEALLHEVANEMAEHHYGCAIVVQNEKLVGIFTTVDACRTITALLKQRYHTQY